MEAIGRSNQLNRAAPCGLAAWRNGKVQKRFFAKIGGKKIKVEVKMGVAVSFFKKFDCNVKKDLYVFLPFSTK
jgi:hypothetical protein